jgi:hypothetical protein
MTGRVLWSRVAAVWLCRQAALARTRWVVISQAQASPDDESRGSRPQHRAARRFPTPRMAVLSSPNVVSDTLHLVRCLDCSTKELMRPLPFPGVREPALLRQRIGFLGPTLC